MFQNIVNKLYRNPRSLLSTWKRFGGYFEYSRMLKAEKEMIIASRKIYIRKPVSDLNSLTVSFLTGIKYWHQTIFCAHTLQQLTHYPIHFIFYDDGTFNEESISYCKGQIENCSFVTASEIEKKLNKHLPKERFPYLHHKRLVYKHIRKITDIHVGNTGYNLVLDSDMLFWREPTELINWLKNPHNPFYIYDVQNSYGFPKEEMEKLLSARIADKINVGAFGFRSEEIDFGALESWAKKLEYKFGNSYYLEQALSAMLIGEKPSTTAPSEKYIVYPDEELVNKKQGILHHYVDISKKWYLCSAWKNVRI